MSLYCGRKPECPKRTHAGPKGNLHYNATLQYTSLKVIFSKCDSENLLFSSTYKHQTSNFHTKLYSEDIYREGCFDVIHGLIYI